MIEKKDWENLLEELKARNVTLLLAVEQDRALQKLCNAKLKEFPKEEMPEDVKDIVKAITNE